jgi:outer membrane murein-binding lipoprotein Lpp
MIMEFTLKQLSWIVIGALGIGGTGYMSMNNKIDELSTKVAVVHSQMEQQTKQLDRIEVKLNTTKDK